MVTDTAIRIATALFVFVCAASDLRARRIPNAVTGPGILVGLLLNTALLGASGLLHSVTGFAAAAIVLFLPFALGGIGGGDVKMMAAVGALAGPRIGPRKPCGRCDTGGAIMIVHLYRRGQLGAKFGALWRMVTFGRADPVG